ncbi:MAG: hypothetical protein GWM90_05485, partial [Gemmatimonadetes bacterium]|nr:hypothetical protein [Gemmatimonadota bacterium]NIQ53214.1 hypothetical protein [Gemmatimonadota bacterium]NIU79750.1 hypothetical protein [Gammaproteobacteria bacterium]NIX43590.1 hypothetical protein [Gemmatimonadota bacterium]NIY07779.1 hypothetical protein [Gemmatimonadota bacterium]
HFLESWGDSEPRPGVRALQQPVMQPVPHFDAKQTGDALLAVAGHLGQDFGATTFYEYLRARYQETHDPAAGDFETAWRDWLKAGFVDGVAPAAGSAPQLRSP